MKVIEYSDPEVQKEWIEFQKLTPEQMDRSNDDSVNDFLRCYPEHIDMLIEVLDKYGVVGLKIKERRGLIGNVKSTRPD